jgi:hypothetical protein
MSLLTSRRPLRARPAVTDLYDEERHTFLVQYPPGAVVAMGVAGVIAIVLTGFQGYAMLRPAPDGSLNYPQRHRHLARAQLLLRHPAKRRAGGDQ